MVLANQRWWETCCGGQSKSVTFKNFTDSFYGGILPTQANIPPSAPAVPSAPTRGRGGRGRPSGRGKGRGRGRGRSQRRDRSNGRGAANSRPDPSYGWRMETVSSDNIALEEVFVNDVIGERTRLFCASALEKLQIERMARQIPESRAGHVVLFMDEALKTCLSCINEHIALKRLDVIPFTLSELYRYVSVMLLSHCTGFSFEKTIELMRCMGMQPPDLARMKFISNNILAFSPTGRGTDAGISWQCQRDQTARLTQFETAAYRTSCKLFLSPTHTLATLDDDLYGTRAADNQVKTISNRKADREGHAADAIADALFRITLMVRFRRRGVSQNRNVSSLLEAILEGRDEQSVHGLILTADRGYAKVKLIRELLRHRIGSIMVMPEHVLQCHPFVGSSFLNVMRNDDMETEEVSDSDESAEEATADPESPPIEIGPRTTSISYDRKRAYVLDDSPGAGPASWQASKRLKSRRGHGDSPQYTSRVTAVAVRERGTEKYSRILRFMYNVPTGVAEKLQTWIAVPKRKTYTQNLFNKRGDDGCLLIPPEDSLNEKDIVERHLLRNCVVLTTSQRCADWFILRQFRVTGTSAGTILCANRDVRAIIGIDSAPAESDVSPQHCLKTLAQGCSVHPDQQNK